MFKITIIWLLRLIFSPILIILSLAPLMMYVITWARDQIGTCTHSAAVEVLKTLWLVK